jgi:hypothetical protein
VEGECRHNIMLSMVQLSMNGVLSSMPLSFEHEKEIHSIPGRRPAENSIYGVKGLIVDAGRRVNADACFISQKINLNYLYLGVNFYILRLE